MTNIHRQLREENSKLKHLGANLSLGSHILQEIVQKDLRPCHDASVNPRSR